MRETRSLLLPSDAFRVKPSERVSRPTLTPASLQESRDYCRQFTHARAENFSVASRLLPRDMRPHFFAIYAYCRWADDLADEAPSPDEALAALDWWESLLDECYAGQPTHPVFVALRETARVFDIQREPFADLLVAFRRDQHPARYESPADVLGYCRYSANPVGRMILHLGRCVDAERLALADQICSGLQWANFCQDVARDWAIDRRYLPEATWRKFGADEAFQRRAATPGFRQALRVEVDRAEDMLRSGLNLVALTPPWLAGDVWLFAQGGLKILARIRAANYDVWTRRPVVTRADHARLLMGWLWRRMLRLPRGSRE